MSTTELTTFIQQNNTIDQSKENINNCCCESNCNFKEKVVEDEYADLPDLIPFENLIVSDTNPPCSSFDDELFQSLMNTHIKSLITKQELHGSAHFFVTSVSSEEIKNTNALLGQYFQCNTCSSFLKEYGNLAVINEDGSLESLIWPDLYDDERFDKMFRIFIRNIRKFVEKSTISHEYFFTKEYNGSKPNVANKTIDGKIVAKTYIHYNFTIPANLVKKEKESVGDFTVKMDMLIRILKDNDETIIAKCHNLLSTNQIYNGEKHVGVIKYLQDVKEKLSGVLNEQVKNALICLCVAKAFVGCLNSLRSGAVSTLLQDLNNNVDNKELIRKWNALNDPLHYMRPSALPSEGAIKNAEKLCESLGIKESDFERVFLQDSDKIPNGAFLYKEKLLKSDSKEAEGDKGIFSSLKTKNKETVSNNTVAEITISFKKFCKDVLPTVKKLEIFLSYMSPIYFFISGKEGSKPLMQWHDESNLASWYTTPSPKDTIKCGLKFGWNEVSSVVSFPYMWDETKKYHHPEKYLMSVKNCKEYQSGMGCALFPALMKSEFHSIRSVIEAYSKCHDIGNEKNADFGGIAFDQSTTGLSSGPQKVRVMLNNNLVNVYNITIME